MLINNPSPPASSVAITSVPAPLDNTNADNALIVGGQLWLYKSGAWVRAEDSKEGASQPTLPVSLHGDLISRNSVAFDLGTNIPAVAGSYSFLTLANQGPTTYYVLLDEVIVSLTGAPFSFFVTDGGTPTGTLIGNGYNRLISSTGASGYVYSDSAAAIPTPVRELQYNYTGQQLSIDYSKAPIVIPYGKSIIAGGANSNAETYVSFHWREVLIG